MIKEFDNAEGFLVRYESIMLEREAVSQLLLSCTYQNRYSKLTGASSFGAVIEEEQAILLFANLLPTNLIIYAAVQDNVSSAAAELGEYFRSHNIIINGIIARRDICQIFLERYKKYNDKTFAELRGMDIMEIRKVSDITPAEGNQRLATEYESKMLTDWMLEFQMEAHACELDYEAALKKIIKYIENQKIYLFENDEHLVVSMALISNKLPHGTVIACVYTPEEFRGKGYAAANIHYLSKMLLDQGEEFCTLLADKKNPLSNRAYEKVGYKSLEESYEYRLVSAE